MLGSRAHHTSFGLQGILTPIPWATGRAVQAATAETGGSINFENDLCCNVMNQEAGILYQLFMQIFGCSLSWRTWKECVLKNLPHCRAFLNPISPPIGLFVCLLPMLSPWGVFTISYLILSFESWVRFLLCSKNTKKGNSVLDFKQHKNSQSTMYKNTSRLFKKLRI